MNRFPYSWKLMAVVALLLLAPMVMPAISEQCTPPYCPHTCPDGWDCTIEWLYDWNNFCTAIALWGMGYTVIVCCNF